jgi:hypothetical protein
MWWIKDNATILAKWYVKCFPFNEDFEWYAKFEKHLKKVKSGQWLTWYVDTKWKEWDDIQYRNWTIYLKKNSKWFNSTYVK